MMRLITIDKYGRLDGDQTALVLISNKCTTKELKLEMENPLCG